MRSLIIVLVLTGASAAQTGGGSGSGTSATTVAGLVQGSTVPPPVPVLLTDPSQIAPWKQLAQVMQTPGVCVYAVRYLPAFANLSVDRQFGSSFPPMVTTPAASSYYSAWAACLNLEAKGRCEASRGAPGSAGPAIAWTHGQRRLVIEAISVPDQCQSHETFRASLDLSVTAEIYQGVGQSEASVSLSADSSNTGAWVAKSVTAFRTSAPFAAGTTYGGNSFGFNGGVTVGPGSSGGFGGQVGGTHTTSAGQSSTVVTGSGIGQSVDRGSAAVMRSADRMWKETITLRAAVGVACAALSIGNVPSWNITKAWVNEATGRLNVSVACGGAEACSGGLLITY